MLFVIIFVAMIVIMGLLIGMWLFRPDLRKWMEQPKHRMLEQERRFDLQTRL